MFPGSNLVYELFQLGFEGEGWRGGDCVCFLFFVVKDANNSFIRSSAQIVGNKMDDCDNS